MRDAELLYQFWFGQGDLADPAYVDARMKVWFAKDDSFDAHVRSEFAPWLGHPRGNWIARPRDFLALVLLHDQVPRNAFRGTARAFAYDHDALALAREAVARGFHLTLGVVEAGFLLLPFEHSESPADQEQSVKLFTELHTRAPKTLEKVIASMLAYAKKHASVIQRFGRFPHRNRILGRDSTPAEVEFLKQPGSTF